MTFGGHGMMMGGIPTIASGYVEWLSARIGTTVVNGYVSQWVGANGHVFAQGIAERRPLYDASTAVPKALLFQSASHWLIGPADAEFNLAPSITGYVVQALVKVVAGGRIWNVGADANSGYNLDLQPAATSIQGYTGDNGPGLNEATSSNTVWCVLTWRKSGSSYSVYRNKTQYVVSASRNEGCIASTATPYIGCFNNGTSVYSGWLTDLVVYYADIGDTAIKANVDALAALNGLAF